ncbi:peptidase family M34 [Erwinia phage pEa_SNUABM_5]|uniref:Peptidase family M34 n=1 Tax=Erwinia phage pEa_SNUABM_5 TaxID=2797313 RepID=A0A7T8EPH6_9CAUD|nr:peptidase family M34 [Erwinia phage pEa_SNUABM_5]QQO90291.1 peptidase family M34 [Erwinia phage pEa_SNUABM_5]
MSVFDFKFRRYLGADTLKSNGVEIQPRDVVGLMSVNDGLAYIASTRYPVVGSIDGDTYRLILDNSRDFTADPSALFKGFDFFLPDDKRSARPSKTPPASSEIVPEVRKPSVNDDSDPAARAAQEFQRQVSKDFGQLRPLEYVRPVYSGGTPGNYLVKKLPRCGKISLEVKPVSEIRDKLPRDRGIHAQDAPDYVMQDIQDNVMPSLGLMIDLPFKRLYVGLTNDARDGTHIVTYRVSGVLYGVIAIDPKQMVALFGGYNSMSVAHATTHELAHFVDHTMIKNVDRMRFEQAIKGKKIHPDTLRSGAISSVPAEHFATLAELMVWGDSIRKVYTLNGVEIVAKYFKNRYIPQSDIDTRKI